MEFKGEKVKLKSKLEDPISHSDGDVRRMEADMVYAVDDDATERTSVLQNQHADKDVNSASKSQQRQHDHDIPRDDTDDGGGNGPRDDTDDDGGNGPRDDTDDDGDNYSSTSSNRFGPETENRLVPCVCII